MKTQINNVFLEISAEALVLILDVSSRKTSIISAVPFLQEEQATDYIQDLKTLGLTGWLVRTDKSFQSNGVSADVLEGVLAKDCDEEYCEPLSLEQSE